MQTLVHSEGRAKYHLERQGFRVFCAQYRKTIRHARKAKSILSPLFPGYLFVQLDVSRARWRSINGTRGVLRLITQCEMPQVVPDGVVEDLLERMDSAGAIDFKPTLRVGQTVRIATGPFTDLVGVLARLDTRKRVQVLLNLLGRSVAVDVEGNALMPAA